MGRPRNLKIPCNKYMLIEPNPLPDFRGLRLTQLVPSGADKILLGMRCCNQDNCKCAAESGEVQPALHRFCNCLKSVEVGCILCELNRPAHTFNNPNFTVSALLILTLDSINLQLIDFIPPEVWNEILRRLILLITINQFKSQLWVQGRISFDLIYCLLACLFVFDKESHSVFVLV